MKRILSILLLTASFSGFSQSNILLKIPKLDTASLSNRIDARVKYTDTASMLSPYARTSNLPSLSAYLLKADSLSGGYTTWLLTKKKIDSLGAVILTLNALKKDISDSLFSSGYTRRDRTKQGLDSLGAVKQDLLSNPITGTGTRTVNFIPRFSGTNTITNSNIIDDGSLLTFALPAFFNGGGIRLGTNALGLASMRIGRNITGSSSILGVLNIDGFIQSDVTSSVINVLSGSRTAAASFSLGTFTHFSTYRAGTGAGSSILNEVSYEVQGSAVGTNGGTAFRGGIASGTNRFNLYMDGTADNHIQGNLLLGTLTPDGRKLRVVGTASFSDTLFGARGVFSNTVTSTSFIRSGGTSTQALMADGSVQTLTSGIYLPTAANVSNTSAITIDTAQFMRVGNVVTVSGRIAFTNTLNSPSQISITLPVATIVSSVRNVAGVGNENIAMKSAIIRGRTGTNDALLEVDGLNSSTYTIYYTYTYRIL